MEKNRNFARLQQEQEEEKSLGFCFEIEVCPQKYYGKPVIVNKEGEMNYQRVSQMGDAADKTEIKYRRVGIASCQGKRPKWKMLPMLRKSLLSVKGKIHQAYTFAVFDGHGGSEAANYAKLNFAVYLHDTHKNIM